MTSGAGRGARGAGRGALGKCVAIVVMLLDLSGCIHGKLPPREYYRLRTAPLPDSLTAFYRDGGASTLPVGSIAIVPYIAPGVYGDGNIVYRIGDSEMGTYPNREWALPVPTMLGMLTEDIFRARPLTRDPVVFDPPSAHSYDYVWRGLVREFEELDRESHVYAVVRFDARLVRARDDSVLWAGTARLERAVPQGTMPAIVDALSQLATEAILQLQESARGSLAGPAASAVRPTPTSRP
ncbi:MAG TPA: ABC-type transport auxiliary lipoprotein family protein [Gemmatimonadaceae bacterium]|nr:ABC-type transport auxiliary lipoprotein family protein [Gemmatimonadaceae bacterium]